MAGQDPSGPDNQRMEALAKQLADLERQTVELGAALQRSGAVRKLLTLVVLVVLGIYLYLFYTKGKSLTDKDNVDRLMTELQLSANANTGEITKQVQALVDSVDQTEAAGQGMDDPDTATGDAVATVGDVIVDVAGREHGTGATL